MGNSHESSALPETLLEREEQARPTSSHPARAACAPRQNTIPARPLSNSTPACHAKVLDPNLPVTNTQPLHTTHRSTRRALCPIRRPLTAPPTSSQPLSKQPRTAHSSQAQASPPLRTISARYTPPPTRAIHRPDSPRRDTPHPSRTQQLLSPTRHTLTPPTHTTTEPTSQCAPKGVSIHKERAAELSS